MSNIEQLKEMKKEFDFFIGIDTDGCVFDTMELKHKECFCPAVIKHMGLQPVSKAAREVWDFINLYSKTRGCNRFLGMRYMTKLLPEHPGVKARGYDVPQLAEFTAWVERETKLGVPALEAEVQSSGSKELKMALDWSAEVNGCIKEMVFGISPFAGVMEVLKLAKQNADVMVVSQANMDALEREWGENGMTPYVSQIAGQEFGTKSEQIRYATEGKGYDANNILMIGDAPGDYDAAMANHALFYPIIPGDEYRSWARLSSEGLAKFFEGTFAGDYQQMLIDEFNVALPEHPPWLKS